MSQSTPTIVTVAQEFSGQHRTFPQAGGHVTQGELQSLATRLRDMIKVAAALADTVEQVRVRAVRESESSLSEPATHLTNTRSTPNPS